VLYARRDEAIVNTFVLHLQDATQYERIEGVASFIGEDRSGSFGILAGHARAMTSLVFGLARFRVTEHWEFLALPGALLYFVDNALYLSTRRFLRDDNYERISLLLEQQLRAEESNLRGMKESLLRLEREMLKRLWKTDMREWRST
jgi:F-type H+-transporting ATPase subunit epsilon